MSLLKHKTRRFLTHWHLCEDDSDIMWYDGCALTFLCKCPLFCPENGICMFLRNAGKKSRGVSPLEHLIVITTVESHLPPATHINIQLTKSISLNKRIRHALFVKSTQVIPNWEMILLGPHGNTSVLCYGVIGAVWHVTNAEGFTC